MAINIDDKGNVDGPGGDFEFSKIRDDSSPGAGDGTAVNTLVYGDFHQFFAKIIEQALITYNDVPENLTNGYQYLEALKKLFVQTEPGNELKTKTFDIGDWDMTSATLITVAHGVDGTKIRTVIVSVQQDTGITSVNPAAVLDNRTTDTKVDWNDTDIRLVSFTAGSYDSTAYDLTPFNRGWITIQYEV